MAVNYTERQFLSNDAADNPIDNSFVSVVVDKNASRDDVQEIAVTIFDGYEKIDFAGYSVDPSDKDFQKTVAKLERLISVLERVVRAANGDEDV